MRTLDEIRVRDPFFVCTEEGYWLFLSHDVKADPSYEGVDACFSADGVHWADPVPALRHPNAQNTYWATEIHPWKGAWYMFVTVTGQMPGCGVDTPIGHEKIRGTRIFRSEHPQGPYAPWSDGPIQPLEHLTLDGTLYVSPDGKPYMVYCHEWLQMVDGTVEAVALTDDLRSAAGEPFLLFRASEAPWCVGQWVGDACGISFNCVTRVTDGVFLFRDRTNALCMLWSTGNGKYQTGLARSPQGTLEGPWEHAAEPIYTEDGGHPMLFQTRKGEWLMALHAPNWGAPEKAQLIPVTFTDNGLAADLTHKGILD